ncbi:MAG: DUF2171 domain-containing protein [Hyphomicrobiaceae bacterium]
MAVALDKSQIREHMTVVGSDGEHVGTVDHVEGDRIKLTRNDPAAGGEHHYIDLEMVETVDDEVHLSKTAEDAKAAATTE